MNALLLPARAGCSEARTLVVDDHRPDWRVRRPGGSQLATLSQRRRPPRCSAQHQFFGTAQPEASAARLLETLLGFYEQAVALDPGFAQAWAGVSRANRWPSSSLPQAVRRLARSVTGRAGDHPRLCPHQNRSSLASWSAPAEVSPQEHPALPPQRFPRRANSRPLNSSSAQAYRPAMSQLINQLSPNPRLQRNRSDPLRPPLSFRTLGCLRPPSPFRSAY